VSRIHVVAPITVIIDRLQSSDLYLNTHSTTTNRIREIYIRKHILLPFFFDAFLMSIFFFLKFKKKRKGKRFSNEISSTDPLDVMTMGRPCLYISRELFSREKMNVCRAANVPSSYNQPAAASRALIHLFIRD
jgi:hypothetical protein